MIKQFETLAKDEQALLLNATVLVSVLASCCFNHVNKYQKADAIKLAHLKTFTAIPLLLPYYAEVERTFKDRFEVAIKKYTPFNPGQLVALKAELNKVNLVMGKLENSYAEALHSSLIRYEKHVKAAHSIFRDFVFPLPIPGISK